jgi:hypothetical protein
LFRGGLTNDILATLLEGESGATASEITHHDYHTERAFRQARTLPVGQHPTQHDDRPSGYYDIASGRYLHSSGQPRGASHRTVSYGQLDSSIDSPGKEDEDLEHTGRVPVHEQRTVLITNLAECTTHQDLAGIIRGGRLLDIFLRNDRTATVSFVEGAAEFLAHAKRNDIYLHMKRVSTGRSISTLPNLTVHSSNSAGQIVNSMCLATCLTKSLVARRATSSFEVLLANSPRRRFETIWTTFTT